MSGDLYKFDLEEHIPEWKAGMIKDKDEFVFAVTENRGDVAMCLLTKQNELYINTNAREKLRKLWKSAYAQNIETCIPAMAKMFTAGHLFVSGVKYYSGPDTLSKD